MKREKTNLCLPFFAALIVWVCVIQSCGGGGGSSSNPGPTAPSAPAFVRLSSVNLRLFVRWSSVSTATRYSVYYSQHSSLPISQHNDQVSGRLSAVYGLHTSVVVSASAVGTYYFAVTASNGAGESVESSRRSITATNTPPPPPPP